MDQHILNAWATEYVQLEARIDDLEADNRVLRELLAAALDQLHSTTIALDRTRTHLHRLLAAQRRSRADRAPEGVAA